MHIVGIMDVDQLKMRLSERVHRQHVERVERMEFGGTRTTTATRTGPHLEELKLCDGDGWPGRNGGYYGWMRLATPRLRYCLCQLLLCVHSVHGILCSSARKITLVAYEQARHRKVTELHAAYNMQAFVMCFKL